MISVLGRLLVLAALFFATTGSFAGWIAGSRRNRAAWRYARNSAYAFSASMIGANLLMVYALVTHDFLAERCTLVALRLARETGAQKWLRDPASLNASVLR